MRKSVAVAPSIGANDKWLVMTLNDMNGVGPEISNLNLMFGIRGGSKGSVLLQNHHLEYLNLHSWVSNVLLKFDVRGSLWRRVEHYGVISIFGDHKLPAYGASVGLPAAAAMFASAFGLDFDVVIGTGCVRLRMGGDEDIEISLDMNYADFERKLDTVRNAMNDAYLLSKGRKWLIVFPDIDQSRIQDWIRSLSEGHPGVDFTIIFANSGTDICQKFSKLILGDMDNLENDAQECIIIPTSSNDNNDNKERIGISDVKTHNNYFLVIRNVGIAVVFFLLVAAIWSQFDRYCFSCPDLEAWSEDGNVMTHLITVGDLKKVLGNGALLQEFEKRGGDGTCMAAGEGAQNIRSRNWDTDENGRKRSDDKPAHCLSWYQAEFYQRQLALKSNRPYMLVPHPVWQKYVAGRKNSEYLVKEWLARPSQSTGTLQYFGKIDQEGKVDVLETSSSTRSPDIYFRLVLKENGDRP